MNSWFSQIPNDWSKSHLKWLAEIYAGGTPSKENESFWRDGTIPWLNSGAVNQKLIDTPSAFITDEALKKSSAKWVPNGALVVALAGQGKTKGTVAQMGLRATCNQSLAAIVPKRIQHRYLFYFLEGNYRNLRGLASDDLRDGLNLELLGAIDCPIPPARLQAEIAAFLDRETAEADALVAKYERLIELLEEKRVGLITRAVTKGLDPSVPMKNSGVEWLRDIPVHWQIQRISRVFRTIGSGTTPPASETEWYGGDTPFVTTADLRENVIAETARSVTARALQRFSSLKIYPAGTVLLAMYGATIGRSAILGVPATVNQACCALGGSTVLSVDFAFKWLQAYRTEITALGVGGGQPNISQDLVKSLLIPIPPIKEQHAITKHLDAQIDHIERLRSQVNSAIVLAKEHRSALIAAAVTGQINVNNYRSRKQRFEVSA